MVTVRVQALAFALVVEALLLFAAFLLPGYGHLAAGAAGGFTAGILAGGGWRVGVELGALVGTVGALFAGVGAVVAMLTVGLDGGALPVFDVTDGTVPHLLGVAGLWGAATVAGAVGASVRGDRQFENPPERV